MFRAQWETWHSKLCGAVLCRYLSAAAINHHRSEPRLLGQVGRSIPSQPMHSHTRPPNDMDWPATTGSACVSRTFSMDSRAVSPRLPA